jgi:membrane protein DedA with SNARE-associated domain
MVPVIRAVISLPAGLAEMKRGPFIALSTVGCFIWTALLAFLGKAAGANWENVSNGFHKAQLPILGVCVLVIGAFIWHRLRSMRADQ